MMLRPPLLVGLVEARRVACHPLLWLSMVPTVWWAVSVKDPVVEHFLLTGYGLAFTWFAAMAIAAAAVRRSHRGAVSEVLDPLPASADIRTLGVGLGGLGAFAVGFAMTSIVWVVISPGSVLGVSQETIPVDLPIPRPTVAQFAQGPLVLLVFASLGLLIGRWVPSWIIVPALFVPVGVVQFLWFGVWNSEGTPWYVWLLPMATGWVSDEWVGDCSTTSGLGSSCDLQLAGFDTGTPWWHAAYLVALAALLVSITVAVDGNRAARRWALVTAVATVALGVVQVLTFERWSA